MGLQRNSIVACVMTMLFSCTFLPVNAEMFDDPQNLKVLPEDITPRQLRSTMRGFAINTGSLCADCHVHEDKDDFDTYDFSLDDKEKKRKARAMILMVQDINKYLADNLDKPAADLVTVDCATCHRGQTKPEMLQDVLERTHGDQGLEAAIAEYRELRERYYGGYSFDFSEGSLMFLAGRLARSGEVEAALGFLQLNAEFYPKSARTYAMQGQAHSMDGNVEAARASFKKSLELDPDNQQTIQMLERLDKQ